MRARALILLVNILIALAGCVTASRSPQRAANPAPAVIAAPAAAALPAPALGARGYLTAGAVDLYRLLPPPPEAGSTQEHAELDELLRLQALRTPATAQRAAADATVSIFRFADALGSPAHFTARDLPLTTALFQRVARSERPFMNAAKDAFDRPRPFVTEKRLSPIVFKPSSASYPSGHTTWAVMCAIVLADMVPERRMQLFARADEYGHNREVAGVHYPSDVAAGHLAGTALANALFQSARFIRDERAATVELRQALGLPALPPPPHH